MEYRFLFTKIFRGALFTDAGNVWLVRNNVSKPGGVFEWETFYEQLAMDVGLGLRLDITFFCTSFRFGFSCKKTMVNPGKQMGMG
ncbi:MAG: BamA/TamA family outer membrane protein [Bacteroidales bacterium]|nr:BamA/TamA family outer membrane protein [Bacteroidales bacterium]